MNLLSYLDERKISEIQNIFNKKIDITQNKKSLNIATKKESCDVKKTIICKNIIESQGLVTERFMKSFIEQINAVLKCKLEARTTEIDIAKETDVAVFLFFKVSGRVQPELLKGAREKVLNNNKKNFKVFMFAVSNNILDTYNFEFLFPEFHETINVIQGTGESDSDIVNRNVARKFKDIFQ